MAELIGAPWAATALSGIEGLLALALDLEMVAATAAARRKRSARHSGGHGKVSPGRKRKEKLVEPRGIEPLTSALRNAALSQPFELRP